MKISNDFWDWVLDDNILMFDLGEGNIVYLDKLYRWN